VPRKLLAAIENPAAKRFAAPMMRTMREERFAPMVPVTTAKVVTAPSIPP
jgi:acyl-CoA reductase-like NAD-dependent aldehyde dehydrogenase